MEVSTTLITMIVLHLKYIPLKQSLTCTFTLWRGVCVCVYIYTYIIINNASQRACGSLGSEVTFAFTAHRVGDLQLFFPIILQFASCHHIHFCTTYLCVNIQLSHFIFIQNTEIPRF